MNQFQKQLSNLRQRQQLLYILVFSFATVMIWLAIGLVTSRKKTGIAAELQELAKPLTPTINRTIIEKLEQKRSYTVNELANFTIYKVLTDKNGNTQVVTLDTPNTALTSSPSPSPSASPSPSPSPVVESVATPSAVASPSAATP